jgi:CheY-like chemotaxis protein
MISKVARATTIDARGSFLSSEAASGQRLVDEKRGQVLMIEAAMTEAETSRWALRALHVDCAWARRGLEGLAAARGTPFDVVLVDAELPDMPAIDVVRRLRAEDESLPVIVLGQVHTREPWKSDRLRGSVSVLPKPFRSTDVIAAVNSILGSSVARLTAGSEAAPAGPFSDHPMADGIPTVSLHKATGSVAERWAYYVLRTIDDKNDPKTVGSWAKAIGVSRGVLSECCRLVHVAAHDARDFARLLRAVCRSDERWLPEAILDLADARTLRKLLTRAGLTSRTIRTPTMPEFLRQQQWIPEGTPGLAALRTLLFDSTRYVSG